MKNYYSTLIFVLFGLRTAAQVGIGTVSPNSMLDLRGSFAPIIRSFSVSTNLTVTDFTLLFTGTAATTATLPDATGCPGRIYCIKNFSVTLPASILTVTTVSSQTIDGTLFWLLNQSNQSVTVISDGVNWEVFGQSTPSGSGSGAWTTTGNAGTSPATNFLGTTDNQSLVFKANNQVSGKIDLALNNTLFGYQTGSGSTGNNNTFIGYQSGSLNTGGAGNTAIGYAALKGNVTGGSNTALGSSAGSSNTTGADNTFVGNGADVTTGGLSNAAAIGYNAKAAVSNSMILGATGAGAVNVGIGINTFSPNPEALLVYQNSSTSFNVIGGKGNLNNYLQLNIQNLNSGSSASSDMVATADNGNETTNYVDLGINSSTYVAGTVTGGADNAYLYSSANDFVIGNSIAGKNLLLFTGGTATTNERMRITSAGNVGINNTTPAATLDVNGTVKVGTAGTVLNAVIRFTNQSITDNTLFNYNQSRIETFTLAGVTQYATVIVTPRSVLPIGLGLAYAYTSAANTVQLVLINGSGFNLALGTVAFDITVIQ